MNFIYVFDEAAKSELLKAGFVLLKEDLDNAIYIFYADASMTFAYENMNYVMSDTISF